MSDIITTLHPENDENTNLYPNIKKENIPSESIDRTKLDAAINSLLNSINELHPSGVDTAAHILAFTKNKGIYIGSDTGNWMNTKIQNIVNGVNQASALLGSTAAMNLMGALGPLASLTGGFDVKEGGIGVQADLRIIKASTGEVVWHKSVIGKKVSKEIGLGGGLVKIGSDKLNAEMYYKAMDDTAQLITDALVADYNAGKLFVK